MSIQEDAADLKPISVRDRMIELENAGADVAPAALPEQPGVAVEERNPAPFGYVTVRVPRFRVFYDGPVSNETRQLFTEAVGYASEPRPRTRDEAVQGITEVTDKSRAVYVDASGAPCAAPVLSQEMAELPSWGQTGRVDPRLAKYDKPRVWNHWSLGRNSGVLRADGTIQE